MQPRRVLWAGVAGVLAFAAVSAAALDWAKWAPYLHKFQVIRQSGVWPGGDILATAGTARSTPSLEGAWAFTTAYAASVWPALVAALVIAAAVEALVPRRWLLGVLARRTRVGGSLVGGVLALPSLMCTCCTAPVAATLRRSGAPTSATLAYWIGNPVLNPAVLAFLALVAPWQWAATRLVAGIVLVFGVTALVARLTDRDRPSDKIDLARLPEQRLADAPRRLIRALARMSVTLIPEYAVVVFLLGLVRGWLFPFDGGAAQWGVLAIVGAAVLGTLVVLPTGGEIPIVQGLAVAGAATGVLGTLLVVLPAVSLVSMAMVARALSVRVTLAAAAGVAVTGVGAGVLLTLLA